MNWPADRGLRIAVNGCFDLFHAAHRDLIHRAMFLSQGGQVLILLDTDDRVTKLKGPGRPVDTLNTRAVNVLTAAGDWIKEHKQTKVVAMPFSSSKELLQKLDEFRPDMIIKGNDFTDVTEVTGYPYHPILIVPRGRDKDGLDISTTAIIEEYTDEETSNNHS